MAGRPVLVGGGFHSFVISGQLGGLEVEYLRR